MGWALKRVYFLGVVFLISACAVKKNGVKNLSYKHESLRAYENAKDYDPTTKKATYKRNFLNAISNTTPIRKVTIQNNP